MVLILEKGECLVSPLEFRPLRFRFEKSLGTPKKFFGQEFVVQSSGETRKKLDGVFCCEFPSSPFATTRTALPPLAFIYGTISRTSTIKLEGTRVPPPLLSRVKLKFPVHFRFLKSIKASWSDRVRNLIKSLTGIDWNEKAEERPIKRQQSLVARTLLTMLTEGETRSSWRSVPVLHGGRSSVLRYRFVISEGGLLASWQLRFQSPLELRLNYGEIRVALFSALRIRERERSNLTEEVGVSTYRWPRAKKYTSR